MSGNYRQGSGRLGRSRNRSQYGVVGIEDPRSWGLSDRTSEANFLNNNDITTLIRDGGFQAWGNRTTSSDPLFSLLTGLRQSNVLSLEWG